ncbi:MAG: carbohydrate binding domain-containing protein [Clostridia bacterium]|nr:carbohydrate binding domain-containing protein [Clostridia bacterium]
MKNAKKLLSMVLSLCLVLTLFAGLTAIAEVENLLAYPENGWHSTVKGEKVPVSFDGTELPFNFTEDKTHYELQAPSFAVEQNATYRLSFSYKLPEGGSLEYRTLAINSSYSSVSGVAFAEYKSLSQTGTEFKNATYAFTVENSAIARIEVRFRTTKNAALETPAVIKNATVVKIESDGSVTNGSFEMVQNGVAIDTTGGELITEGALYGNNMMKVTAGKPMSLTLALAKISTNAKLRGLIKATGFTSESKATLSVKTADGTPLAEKSFNLAPVGDAVEDTIWNINADTWEFVRMSYLPYSDGMKFEAEVEGEGALYLDGFTFENDYNLVRNAAFVPEGDKDADGMATTWAIELTRLNELLGKKGQNVYLNDSYTDPETKEVTSVGKTDGNCPDGQYYVEAKAYQDASGMILIRTRSSISVSEGEKYRISLWLKTENTAARLLLDPGTQTSAIKANYPGWNQFIVDESTDGEWKQYEFTLTIPKGMTTFNLCLRTQGRISGEKKVSFCMPVVEKITENEVGFYAQAFENAPSDAGGVQVVAPKIERYGYAFQNVLGTPIETATGFGGTITAVGITTAPQVTADDIVIIAAYKKDAYGKKQLVTVKMGEEAATPAWTTTVTDANNANQTVTGVNYPTATIHTDELGDATEIRAFLWNSVSGLTPTGTAAKLAR